MRRCVSIGAVLIAAASVGGDVASVAAPNHQLANKVASVDVELVSRRRSHSMDTDELAVQREGYAQAIVSKEFLQALNTGVPIVNPIRWQLIENRAMLPLDV
jgi:Protein of unknown function (DUF1194)